MLLDKTVSVGAVVAEQFRAAEVFNFYGIDFCCAGERTLEAAASEHQIELDVLLNALSNVLENEAEQGSVGLLDFKAWSLELLVDYVIKYHHRRIREVGPKTLVLLEKVCEVHGEDHPELHDVRRLYESSLNELTLHLQKEERILFPFIYQIAQAYEAQTPMPQAPFGTVENPINMMMHEHDQEGERMRQISELTGKYRVPENACNSYRQVMRELHAFETHLHEHIHIENNIIFPRAIHLEKGGRL